VDEPAVPFPAFKPCSLGDSHGCLIPHANNTGAWRCAICHEVSHWVAEGHPYVIIAAANPDGVRVFPADRAEKGSGWLFILDVESQSLPQMRVILQHVADTVGRIRLWESATGQYRLIDGRTD
jgi:hypothetical protein